MDKLYKCVDGVHVELVGAELEKRRLDGRIFQAWRAFEDSHPGRRFKPQEKRAFKAAFIRGETYVPAPPEPTLKDLVLELQRQVNELKAAKGN